MRTSALKVLTRSVVPPLLLVVLVAAPVGAVQPLDAIQLDSGLLLRDWIDLPEVQAVNSPLETGALAAGYIKRYGAYRELIQIVWKASKAKTFEERSITEENAPQKLAELDSARRSLGEWPQLVISHARAQALCSNPAGALADLKIWLKVAPNNDKRRKEIVALVMKSEKDGDAVTSYFASGGKGGFGPDLTEIKKRPLPDAVTGKEQILKQVMACVGRARSAIDSELVIEGTYTTLDNRFRMRMEHRSFDRGLYSVKTSGIETPDTKLETSNLITPIAQIYHESVSRMVGGILKGGVYRVSEHLAEITCNTPFFPIEVGKEFKVQQVTSKKSVWSNNSYVNVNDTFALEYNTTMRIEKEYSVAEALRQFPNLRIIGSATENWIVYEVSNESEWKYRSIEVADSGTRQYYTPGQSRSTMLFVEGPNVLVYFDWGKTLRSDWTATIRELQ